jgi:hypothetical protein
VADAKRSHEAILGFLMRELPPSQAKQASYLTNALIEAGKRYDRRQARKDEWTGYNVRRGRLLTVSKSAQSLASSLSKLDVLSRYDLDGQVGSEWIEALIGSLLTLSSSLTKMIETVQKSGRPRDLAEERWIFELADIYENAFDRPARVWGAGSDTTKKRGGFYNLLEVCRPGSFPRYGKLSLRQVQRSLYSRNKERGAIALMKIEKFS